MNHSPVPWGFSLERAMEIDMSRANFTAKSPIFRRPPLRCPPPEASSPERCSRPMPPQCPGHTAFVGSVRFANPPAYYRSLSGPSAPTCPQSVPRVSPGGSPKTGGVRRSVQRGVSEAFGPRAPECPESVPRMSPECQKVSRTISGLFQAVLGHLR